MGKNDVTVGQYCQFLNAVAATDTYGLYNLTWRYDYYSTVGITQSGSPGSYTYSVSYTASAWTPYVAYNSSLYPSALAAANDAPVFDVTWGDSARFANWLQNGQPTNLGEAAGSTETGAYTLNGATSQSALMAIRATPGPRTSSPRRMNGIKQLISTPSTTVLGLPHPEQFDAEQRAVGHGNQQRQFLHQQLHRPDELPDAGGAFAGSPGPFGTFDMGGDLFQWNEAKHFE